MIDEVVVVVNLGIAQWVKWSSLTRVATSWMKGVLGIGYLFSKKEVLKDLLSSPRGAPSPLEFGGPFPLSIIIIRALNCGLILESSGCGDWCVHRFLWELSRIDSVINPPCKAPFRCLDLLNFSFSRLHSKKIYAPLVVWLTPCGKSCQVRRAGQRIGSFRLDGQPGRF